MEEKRAIASDRGSAGSPGRSSGLLSREATESSSDAARPLLSVIVKTLNEERKIAGCLASVLQETEPYPTQVIVADSRSDDATVAVARRFGVNVVRLAPSEPRGCGIGAQLGFQCSSGKYVLLIDGDMRLAAGFLPKALQALEEDQYLAGIAGRVDLDEANLEYRLRRKRYVPHLRPGPVDRLDGGGIYRRAAIDEWGYLTNRNLHSFEEFELGLRLRATGWRLMRLAETSVHHYGHRMPAWSLLLQRWQSRYTDGQGELLRATLGGRLAALAAREFWLSFAVVGWWICLLTCILLSFAADLPAATTVLLALLPFVLCTLKCRSLSGGCYTVALWQVNAAGLIRGFLRPQVEPKTPIAAEMLNVSSMFPAQAAPSPPVPGRGPSDSVAVPAIATSLKRTASY